MFDMFPQQNFCDLLKSTALHWFSDGQKDLTIASIKRLESARVWRAPVFAQAIDQVFPGAIWIDNHDRVRISGGPATLEKIVDVYLELTGQPIREVS